MSFSLIRRNISFNYSTAVSGLTLRFFAAIRGIEKVVKDQCCEVAEYDCIRCNLHDCCSVVELFSQALSSDPAVVKSHQKPPLPFAVHIAVEGNLLQCFLTVAGSAIGHVGVITSAIVRCALSLGCELERIVNVGYHGEEYEIIGNELVLLAAEEVMERTDNCTDSFGIKIVTPMRLMSQGVLCRSFDIATLVRSQMRRLSALAAYYGDAQLHFDFARISQSAAEIVPLIEHYAFDVVTGCADKHKFGGLVGHGEYHCRVREIAPLLRLASYFNAGKGASFGMGCYRIYPLNASDTTTAVL